MAKSTVKEILKFSSDSGVYMGLYLTAMSACILLSMKIPSLPLLLLPLMAGTPVILWLLLRPLARRDAGNMTLFPLWLAGIYIFIFGTLVCGLFSAAYLLFADPTFISTYVRSSVEAVEASPELAAAMAPQLETMREALGRNIIPSPMQYTTMMMWTTAFFGSILSLLVAAAMTFTGRMRRTPADV